MILAILKEKWDTGSKGLVLRFNCISPTKIEKAISWCINPMPALPRPLPMPRRWHLRVSSHLQHVNCSPAISSATAGLFPHPQNAKITWICRHEPPRLNKHLSVGNTVSNYSCNQHRAPALSLRTCVSTPVLSPPQCPSLLSVISCYFKVRFPPSRSRSSHHFRLQKTVLTKSRWKRR